MARKSKAAPQPVEPGDGAQEAEGGGQEGHGFAPGNGKSITKSEAVRRALADGVVLPADGVAYIESHFGLKMGPTHFSAVKSNHPKKQGATKVRAKGGPKRADAGPRPTPAIPANGEADLLQALEAIKPLVASLGVDKVKRLAERLG